jgi:hypothetical protein
MLLASTLSRCYVLAFKALTSDFSRGPEYSGSAGRLCSKISAWIVEFALQHVPEQLYLTDMECAMGNRDEDPVANTEVLRRRWNPVEVGLVQRGNEVQTFSPDFLNPLHHVGD